MAALAGLDFSAPRAKAQSRAQPAQPAQDERAFVRELMAAMQAQSNAIAETLERIRAQFQDQPAVILAHFAAHAELAALLAVADTLPAEAFAGPFKHSGVVEPANSEAAAQAFAAYLLLAAVRVSLFAERRGLANLRAAAIARRADAAPRQPEHLLRLIDGFPALADMLEEPALEASFGALADTIWAHYQPEHRGLVAAGALFEMMIACGREWSE